MQLDTGKSQGVNRLTTVWLVSERRDWLTRSCAACQELQDNCRSRRVRALLHPHTVSRVSRWIFRFGRLYRGLAPPCRDLSILRIRTTPRSRSSFVARSSQACHQIVCAEPLILRALGLIRSSAANDFWGKTFLQLSGEKKMNQQLSIMTGCAAG